MIIYTKKDFEGMSPKDIDGFIKDNKDRLAGSAVFTKNKTLISKLVCWTTRGREPEGFFVPSHVGSIINSYGMICVFNMVPPKSNIISLAQYIFTNDDDFIIICPDFDINVKRFTTFILQRIGQKYGYMSALQSAFRGLKWSSAEHCSEIHLKGLQEQGFFADYDANKTTPNDLLHILTTKEVIFDANVAKRD